MSSSLVLVLAFLIGVVAGLRSMTAPAVVAWAAHQHWIDLHGSSVGFMASTVSVVVFTVLTAAELTADKLPSTPNRTTLVGFIPRVALGGLSGAAIAAAGSQSSAIGAALGAIGAVVGTFAGFQARTRLVVALKVPDFVIACLEDVVAIGGGLLIVSRL